MGGERYDNGMGTIITFFLIILGLPLLAIFSICLIFGVISVSAISIGWPVNIIILIGWVCFVVWIMKT